jgi:hypothetical protein
MGLNTESPSAYAMMLNADYSSLPPATAGNDAPFGYNYKLQARAVAQETKTTRSTTRTRRRATWQERTTCRSTTATRSPTRSAAIRRPRPARKQSVRRTTTPTNASVGRRSVDGSRPPPQTVFFHEESVRVGAPPPPPPPPLPLPPPSRPRRSV